MMKTPLRTGSIFIIAVKRLRSQSRLTLAAAGGLIILIGLVMSIPAYADAVSYRILSTNLMGSSLARLVPDVPRAPFLFSFQYSAPFRGATHWAQAQGLDAYMVGQASRDLGLPLKWSMRYLKTYAFKLYAPADVEAPDRQDAFAWAGFFALSDAQAHIRVIEGRFPAPAQADPASPVEVLVSQALATSMGLSVGDHYVAYYTDADSTVKIPVTISGVWRASDPTDLYWPVPLKDIYNDLLVPENTYLQRLAPNLKDGFNMGVWSMALDSANFHASDVTAFTQTITRVEISAARLLNGALLAQSPKKLLLDYRQTTGLLTLSLTAFSIPVATLFLAFINLVGSVTVERQRNEIAVMRSRGASLFQMAGISLVEGSLLVGVALLLGIPVSKGILLLMGKTRSFLDFSLPPSLRLDITWLSVLFSLAAAVLVLLARLFPVVAASRYTITTYKQERARNLHRPWWQRAWLELWLLAPAVYGTYLLRKQGNLLVSGASASDPFQNPLLLLVPALGILAVTLFLIRVLPWVMAGIAWLAAHGRSVSLLLASRYLSRTSGFFSVPLMLLVLTLSLSAFIATLAQTLDNHNTDQQYYYSGADVRLVEYGQCLKSDAVGNCNYRAATDTSPTWSFLPVSSHLKAPGVLAATRLGTWSAAVASGARVIPAAFIGIDRLDFPKVAFWRKDFAAASLGELMNDLAASEDGVLVSRQYMKQEVLKVGDSLTLSVDVFGKQYPISLSIVGSFDYFPTWYPDAGPLFVGNLDNFFFQIQGQQPYNVLLKTTPGVSCAPLVTLLKDPKELGLDVQSCVSARQMVGDEQKRPEHQGLFGLLSVGFAGAGLLTVLGFLLYALFSFQQRFIEMGVLRAVGLSIRQMGALLAWELAFLIGIGMLAGTGLGLLVSRLFIPYLQLGATAAAKIPPFVVAVAWGRIFQIYALFGLLFIAALAGLTSLLVRMKIFQAVKLGETT